MASKIVIFILAAVCIAQISGKPSGEPDNLEKLANQAGEFANNAVQEISKVLKIENTQDTKEFTEKLKTNANELAGKLSDALTTLTTEAKTHAPDVEAVVTDMKTKINEVVGKIQKAHPDETAKAKEYQAEIEKIYTEMAAQVKSSAEKLGKDSAGIQEDVSKFFSGVFNAVKSQAELLDSELKKSLEAHEKTHKH